MNTVHVRVSEGSTGKPTPVRIRFLDTRGTVHVPFGRLAHFSVNPGEDVGGNVLLEGAPHAYIAGACEVRLPAGEIRVSLAKGPEYVPVTKAVTLGPGQISLRLQVERWVDLRAEGWYAGDIRAHDLSPHAALLEGAAEGLAVVHLLARERPEREARPPALPNLLAFSGIEAALHDSECLVAVNTLNVHPVLGSVALLNCHRPVFPLRFGGEKGLDDWSVLDWCEQCHRKKGLVVWPDLPRLSEEHPQGEALAALLLGEVDAFEVSPFQGPLPDALDLWYDLLQAGQRLPLVAGSGKESNREVLGALRTYGQLREGEAFSLAAWIEAVRAGRTFVTGGPLVKLKAFPLDLTEKGEAIRFRAEATSAVGFSHLEVVANGQVIASTGAGEGHRAELEGEVVAEGPGWLAARCRGENHTAFAHTSALSWTCPPRTWKRSLARTPESVARFEPILNNTGRWVEHQARCPQALQREHLLDVLGRAREKLHEAP
jgi:hypothetical protein